MSDAVSEWLDAAEANTHRKVALGQSVARELDRLLANDRANLVRAIAALRGVAARHYPDPSGSYCDPCTDHSELAWPCVTLGDIAEALEVEWYENGGDR